MYNLIFSIGMELFKTHVGSIFLAVTFSSHLLFIIASNPCQPSLSIGTFSDGFYFQAIIGLVNQGTFSCGSVDQPFRKQWLTVHLKQ